MTTPSPKIESSSPLSNPDLAPTVLPGEPAPAIAEPRTWGTYNYAALWVSMSVNILTYMLAASLIQGGMDWKQAVFTVFLGNCIVLGADAAELASRRALRNSLPGTGASIVWSAGSQHRGGSARAGRLRLVRHSNLDRRRSDQRSSRDGLAGLEIRPAWSRHLLSGFSG